MKQERKNFYHLTSSVDDEYDDDAIKKYLMKQAIYEKESFKFSQLPNQPLSLTKYSLKMWLQVHKEKFLV